MGPELFNQNPQHSYRYNPRPSGTPRYIRVPLFQAKKIFNIQKYLRDFALSCFSRIGGYCVAMTDRFRGLLGNEGFWQDTQGVALLALRALPHPHCKLNKEVWLWKKQMK
jgi:hypothetical protein